MPRRKKIALLIETSNSYARGVLQGIRSWLNEFEHWSIRFSEQGRGAAVPDWLHEWQGDGVIARVENASIAKTLRATGLPVIDVSAALPRSIFPRVATNSREATQLAARHLVERGFKRFGYCGAANFLWSDQRGTFFGEYLRGLGHSCDLFSGRDPGRPAESHSTALGRWLKSLPKPVGILACYDLVGQQVLDACRDAGMVVPDEVGVIGIHNDELLCELCDPPLSSVIPDAPGAGYQASALLARMMEGEEIAPSIHLVEPIGIAIRQSTDVVAVSDPKIAAAVRFMRDHACEGITVSDVLRAVPMSRTLLEREFKKLLERTPHAYLLGVRMDRVKMLLATTNLSIGTIAERTGFEHAEYLSVAFRRLVGMTPRAYHHLHRNVVKGWPETI